MNTIHDVNLTGSNITNDLGKFNASNSIFVELWVSINDVIHLGKITINLVTKKCNKCEG